MKVNKILVGSMALLAFAACKNDKQPTQTGDTYARVTVGFADQLRQDTNGQGEEAGYAGTSIEDKFTSLDFLSSGSGSVQSLTKASSTENPVTYTSSAFKTNSGAQAMGLALNLASRTNLTAKYADLMTNPATFTYPVGAISYTGVSDFYNATDFLMISDIKNKTIAKKTEDEVKAAEVTDETNNNFQMELERVVAKGVVYTTLEGVDGKIATTNNDQYKGKIVASSIQYTPGNVALKTFVARNNAGTRQIANLTTAPAYTGFKAAVNLENTADLESAADAADAFILRLGNAGNEAKADGVWAAKNVVKSTDAVTNYAANATKEGFYFFESSYTAGWNATNGVNGYDVLPYAKVYVQYVPDAVLVYNNTSKAFETNTLANIAANAAGAYSTEAVTAATAGTFYKGLNDGKLYAAKYQQDKPLAADREITPTTPNKEYYTYAGGKCGYRALWNRLEVSNVVAYASIRRNNVYVLNITEFAGLGFPWDPSDPSDPNLPKPDDDPSDDPTDDDINETENYMRVTAKVLKWNVLGRDVKLKNL